MTIVEGEVIKVEEKHQIGEYLIDVTAQKLKFSINDEVSCGFF